jgi:hypothetical protein
LVLGTGDFHSIPVAYPWIIRKKIKVPHGLMMAFDDRTVWGVHRDKGYTVFSMPRPDPNVDLPDFRERKSAKIGGWTARLSIRPRAMLRAGDLLFFGGMPKDTVLGEKNPGHVVAVSCKDGKPAGERINIPSPPVWDGMAAVPGKLIIPCEDGSVICLSGK